MGKESQELESSNAADLPSEAWARDAQEIAGQVEVDPEVGLDEGEVGRRRERYGVNRLREVKERSVWSILIDQVDDLVIMFLLVTAVIALLLGYWVEGIAVGVVVLITTTVGMAMELRARQSMKALREMGQASATVLREGEAREISAEEIVPGDIILIDEGEVISADIRLVEASRLLVNESALTGESAAVDKDIESIEADTPLAERENMLFAGTAVTRGTGKGIVVATGMHSELGEISSLVESADELDTPLEKRLNKLASRLIWLTLGLSALVFPAGLIAGQPFDLIATTAIALAIATVPEGLPVVATLTLARGMMRMARHNALMRRLASVETLGATTLICTDKTGTLTMNRMSVESIWTADGRLEIDRKDRGATALLLDDAEVVPEDFRVVAEAIEVGLLCNNASLDPNGSGVGEPMEVALLQLGEELDMTREDVIERLPEVREESFDPEVKMMATYHEEDAQEGDFRVVVKGAPEEVIKVCDTVMEKGEIRQLGEEGREEWIQRNEEMSGQGFRILAFASRRVNDEGSEPYEDLTLLGLVAFSDPPRPEVRQALIECKKAGVRVVMVTGDQVQTARHIAEKIGLIEADDPNPAAEGKELRPLEELSAEERERLRKVSIFARVSPKQKLTLIDLHQEAGEVVAMTGDGVNDAPALTGADIGVAMGQRGTQVARDAADLVLLDDRFATIVHGIEEGRLIFTNIRRFVVFLLSINFASIVAITTASLLGVPIPVTPLQILYLNMVTDIFPALALVTTGGAAALMEGPPRPPEESVLTKRHWLRIGGYGVVLALFVLVSLALALLWLEYDAVRAVTVSFLTLGLGKAFHSLNMRGTTPRPADGSATPNPVLRNGWVWSSIALCAVLLVVAVYFPWLSGLLETVGPGVEGWTVAVVLGVAPLLLIQVFQFLTRRS